MATGYSRQSSGVIVTSATIQASHFNNEYDALLAAFHASTGHNHDGTSGGGAPIPTAGVSGLTSTSAGIVCATGSNAVVARTLTAPAAGITVTNGTGASGNPTLVLANDLAALEGLGSTGIAVRSASDTWVQRTITGTSNRLTVTDGNGVSGNPTLDISSSYVGQATITTLGTIATGVWNGTAITGTYGGTGVNNGSNTITLAGNLVTSGANSLTLTTTGATNVTLPTTGTLSTLTGSETFTNKTLTSPTINSPTVNTPTISGGTLDNCIIGGSTAAAGTFTDLTNAGTILLSTAGGVCVIEVNVNNDLTISTSGFDFDGDVNFQDPVTTDARILNVSVKTSAGDVTSGASNHVHIINKSSGAATQVTLPSSPSTGRVIVVKDGKGDAASNNITVVAASGNIDGSASNVISTNYGSRTYVYNGTQWNVIGN